MARSPRGSFISHWPTAFPRRMRSGGLQGSSGTGLNQNLVIFNDAQDGSYLVVWDLSVCVAAPTNVSPTTPIASGGSSGGGLGGTNQVISFVGVTTSQPGAVSTLSINRPAGVINGDLMLTSLLGFPNLGSTPAGWTKITNPIDGGNLYDRWSPDMQGGGLFKKFANNEPSSYSWGWGGMTAFPAATLLAYRNVDQTVVDTDRDTTTQSSVTTATSPALTTTIAQDWIVTIFAILKIPSGTTTFSGAPGDETQRSNMSGTNGTAFGMWTGDKIAPIAGAIGAESITLSQASDAGGAQIALRPSGSAPQIGTGGAPVVPGTGALPGAGLITTGSGAVIGNYIFLTGAGLWRWQHDFPFVAIPGGQSYIVNLTGDCAGWDIAFEYEVVRDI